AARQVRALLGRAHHRLEVVLLIGGLVLDPQRLEVRSARAITGLEETPRTRRGIPRERAAGLLRVVAPQIERGLLDVELQIEESVIPVRFATALQIRPSGIAVAECERRPGRPEQCARAPQRILAALGQGEPPLE